MRTYTLVCDRCGAEQRDPDGSGSAVVSVGRVKPVDLCSGCTDALEAWLRAAPVAERGRSTPGLAPVVERTNQDAPVALAPVVSISDGKTDEERTAETSELLAAARANPDLFPHVPDYLKRR